MIKLGSNSIGKIYLGSNSIGKAYLGNNLVFEKGSSPSPSVTPVYYDRLVFDGTAYIETDIVPVENASFRCNFGNETTESAQRLFSAAAGEGTVAAIINASSTATYRYFSVYYCDSSAVSWSDSSHRLGWTNSTYTFWLTPNAWGYGAANMSFTKGSSTPTGGLKIGTNTSNTGQPYTGDIGIFWIYGSDAQNCTSSAEFGNYTPIKTLRPCTYNGAAGLWCVETSTFYGNTAGSGTLTVRNNE